MSPLTLQKDCLQVSLKYIDPVLRSSCSGKCFSSEDALYTTLNALSLVSPKNSLLVYQLIHIWIL